jgi:hypothetical protein
LTRNFLKIGIIAYALVGFAAAQQRAERVCTDLSGKIPVACPQGGSQIPDRRPAASIDPTQPPPTQPMTAPAATSGGPVQVGHPVSREAIPAPRPAVAKASAAASQPYRSLERSFALNLVTDQKNFWTSPLRLRTEDAAWALPLVGGMSVLVLSDVDIERHLPSNVSLIKNSKSFSNYGAAGYAGLVAGGYLWGRATHNDHLTETAVLSGEAAINSLLITEGIKYLAGRQRPLEGDSTGSFRQGGSSFPSLHSAGAWAIASVVAHEYPGPLTKLFAYGGAAAISAARVTGRQHFTSDALVGTAVGWFVGRQVFNAHLDRDNPKSVYGTFEHGSADRGPRDPSKMGSPYVPLDSWVYPAMDRLAAMGYIHTAFAGLRPWTRMECARLVEEAATSGIDSDANMEATRLYAALASEFAAADDTAAFRARVESVYARVAGISDRTLNDGYHFGQTLINDYGRPYQQGANAILGVSASAEVGPFAFYVRGEFQHAPSAPPLPLTARQAIATVDLLPLAPPLPQAAVDRFVPVEAYASVKLANWQISVGRQALWWGPDRSGPMLLSTNSQPIDMLRISDASPTRLPGLLKFLGPVRAEFFLGRVSGYEFMYEQSRGLIGTYGHELSNPPYIHGQKFSFKPTANFELGFSRTTMMGGSVYPFTLNTFARSLVSTSNQLAGASNKAGDRRAGLDFNYRIPKLRNWLTFYADGFTDDEYSPIAYWDRSAWTSGLYLSHVPGIDRLDLRVEGVYTDLPAAGPPGPSFIGPGFFYFNGTWRSGYTNRGSLIGSWIGRGSQGAQAWTTYHLSPRNFIQAGYRHQKVSKNFIAGGGTMNELSVRSDYWVLPSLSISTVVQYSKWDYPVLAPTAQNPLVGSIQVSFWPARKDRK